MIKVFADECIYADFILKLRSNGIDVLTAKDAGLKGKDDETIFAFAQKQKRILLTFDRGFGDIFRFNIKRSHGVIIVLINQMNSSEIPNITLLFISTTKEQNLRGKLVIIGKTKIRISER